MLSFIFWALGHSYASLENYLAFGSCLNIHSLQETLCELRYSQHSIPCPRYFQKERRTFLSLKAGKANSKKITCEFGQFLNCSIFHSVGSNDYPTLLREGKEKDAKVDWGTIIFKCKVAFILIP